MEEIVRQKEIVRLESESNMLEVRLEGISSETNMYATGSCPSIQDCIFQNFSATSVILPAKVGTL